jgi:hypothetical protein
LNDGQGQVFAMAGIPFAVEKVAAPAGSDADAILALATPMQSTAGGPAIDLEFQLPPSVTTDGGAGSVDTFSRDILIGMAAALFVAWIVRR